MGPWRLDNAPTAGRFTDTRVGLVNGGIFSSFAEAFLILRWNFNKTKGLKEKKRIGTGRAALQNSSMWAGANQPLRLQFAAEDVHC